MSGSRVPKANFPLQGMRVILTQSSEQCDKLEKLLNIEQAVTIKIPTIDFKLVNHLEQIDRALDNLEQYDLLVLTSQNSFEFLYKLLKQRSSLKFPDKLKIAAVGDETKQVIEDAGFKVSYVPENQKTSDQLAEYLIEKVHLNRKKVLFPKSSLSNSKLPEKLRKAGAWVDDIVLYETSTNPDSQNIFNAVMGYPIDWILFSSPSAVRSFFSFASYEEVQSWIFDLGIKVGSIGSTTTKELIEMHIPVAIQSPRPSSKVLIQSIKEFEEYDQF
ncbi:MAG: uroporphyrinogen-III synthase [Proteobacteria bacterium]|jgi:uroporphyrinogen-III synthase|nr:uroporphyrinogen-III synthase [Pseudomonadota bacterium]